MFEERIEEMNKNLEYSTNEMSEYEKRVYTMDEIQDILRISKTTAYSLVKKDVFHSVRIGGVYRISKKSFDEWLDSKSSGKSQVCD